MRIIHIFSILALCFISEIYGAVLGRRHHHGKSGYEPQFKRTTRPPIQQEEHRGGDDYPLSFPEQYESYQLNADQNEEYAQPSRYYHQQQQGSRAIGLPQRLLPGLLNGHQEDYTQYDPLKTSHFQPRPAQPPRDHHLILDLDIVDDEEKYAGKRSFYYYPGRGRRSTSWPFTGHRGRRSSEKQTSWPFTGHRGRRSPEEYLRIPHRQQVAGGKGPGKVHYGR